MAADARGEVAQLQLRDDRAHSQLETTLARCVVSLVTLQSVVTLDFVETLKSLASPHG